VLLEIKENFICYNRTQTNHPNKWETLSFLRRVAEDSNGLGCNAESYGWLFSTVGRSVAKVLMLCNVLYNYGIPVSY
jgi:hypothetical protein